MYLRKLMTGILPVLTPKVDRQTESRAGGDAEGHAAATLLPAVSAGQLLLSRILARHRQARAYLPVNSLSLSVEHPPTPGAQQGSRQQGSWSLARVLKPPRQLPPLSGGIRDHQGRRWAPRGHWQPGWPLKLEAGLGALAGRPA
jgi:hypothetical protein